MDRELVRLALLAVAAHRLRSALSVLGIAIGIAAVILLTSIGEGTRRFMLGEFTQFGTNILSVMPGKSKTLGLPGVLGGTTHKLTLDDAVALRRLPGIEESSPLAFGTGRIEHGERSRSVNIYGVTPAFVEVFKFRPQLGGIWPGGDPHRSYPMAVLGSKLRGELFGDRNPLGQFVRIGGARFRVVGVMEPKGQFIGIDLDDTAFIPVASAMRVFNQAELIEVDLLYTQDEDAVVESVRRMLSARHAGNEDFTILTQEAMLQVLGNVMNVVTMAVGAIAGISLVVGAIGILTMMWITVRERTGEIGLARAVGASTGQVASLFLIEAAAVALLGGAAGVAIGFGLGAALRWFVPGLPVETPLSFVVLALVVSLAVGLLSGVLPARRAARLDPIEALRAE
jgi:putative ABC transport system permease protein